MAGRSKEAGRKSPKSGSSTCARSDVFLKKHPSYSSMKNIRGRRSIEEEDYRFSQLTRKIFTQPGIEGERRYFDENEVKPPILNLPNTGEYQTRKRRRYSRFMRYLASQYGGRRHYRGQYRPAAGQNLPTNTINYSVGITSSVHTPTKKRTLLPTPGYPPPPKSLPTPRHCAAPPTPMQGHTLPPNSLPISGHPTLPPNSLPISDHPTLPPSSSIPGHPIPTLPPNSLPISDHPTLPPNSSIPGHPIPTLPPNSLPATPSHFTVPPNSLSPTPGHFIPTIPPNSLPIPGYLTIPPKSLPPMPLPPNPLPIPGYPTFLPNSLPPIPGHLTAPLNSFPIPGSNPSQPTPGSNPSQSPSSSPVIHTHSNPSQLANTSVFDTRSHQSISIPIKKEHDPQVLKSALTDIVPIMKLPSNKNISANNELIVISDDDDDDTAVEVKPCMKNMTSWAAPIVLELDEEEEVSSGMTNTSTQKRIKIENHVERLSPNPTESDGKLLADSAAKNEVVIDGSIVTASDQDQMVLKSESKADDLHIHGEFDHDKYGDRDNDHGVNGDHGDSGYRNNGECIHHNGHQGEGNGGDNKKDEKMICDVSSEQYNDVDHVDGERGDTGQGDVVGQGDVGMGRGDVGMGQGDVGTEGDVGHGDTSQGDVDTCQGDVGHGDTTSEGDVYDGDTEGEVGHSDTGQGDVGHGDTEGDVGQGDVHCGSSDQGDVGHGDTEGDVGQGDVHRGSSDQGDVGHGDNKENSQLLALINELEKEDSQVQIIGSVDHKHDGNDDEKEEGEISDYSDQCEYRHHNSNNNQGAVGLGNIDHSNHSGDHSDHGDHSDIDDHSDHNDIGDHSNHSGDHSDHGDHSDNDDHGDRNDGDHDNHGNHNDIGDHSNHSGDHSNHSGDHSKNSEHKDRDNDTGDQSDDNEHNVEDTVYLSDPEIHCINDNASHSSYKTELLTELSTEVSKNIKMDEPLCMAWYEHYRIHQPTSVCPSSIMLGSNTSGYLVDSDTEEINKEIGMIERDNLIEELLVEDTMKPEDMEVTTVEFGDGFDQVDEQLVKAADEDVLSKQWPLHQPWQPVTANSIAIGNSTRQLLLKQSKLQHVQHNSEEKVKREECPPQTCRNYNGRVTGNMIRSFMSCLNDYSMEVQNAVSANMTLELREKELNRSHPIAFRKKSSIYIHEASAIPTSLMSNSMDSITTSPAKQENIAMPTGSTKDAVTAAVQVQSSDNLCYTVTGAGSWQTTPTPTDLNTQHKASYRTKQLTIPLKRVNLQQYKVINGLGDAATNSDIHTQITHVSDSAASTDKQVATLYSLLPMTSDPLSNEMTPISGGLATCETLAATTPTIYTEGTMPVVQCTHQIPYQKLITEDYTIPTDIASLVSRYWLKLKFHK